MRPERSGPSPRHPRRRALGPERRGQPESRRPHGEIADQIPDQADQLGEHLVAQLRIMSARERATGRGTNSQTEVQREGDGSKVGGREGEARRRHQVLGVRPRAHHDRP
jgi:hypothetical protein